jgi:hypothetical protein
MSHDSDDNLYHGDDDGPYLTALVYDPEEAAKYISERTGVPLGKARLFVHTCNYYDLLLGIAPVYDEDDAQEIARKRIEYADLLPSDSDCVDYNLLRAYVEQTTDLSSAEVVNMIAEDVGYYVRQNIMEPEAYEDVRMWADKVMTTFPPR